MRITNEADENGVEQCLSRSTGRVCSRRHAAIAAASSSLLLPSLAPLSWAVEPRCRIYVDVLSFDSLGYRDLFWKTLSSPVGSTSRLSRRAHLSSCSDRFWLSSERISLICRHGHTILIGGQPVKLPVEPVLRLIALGVSLVIAAATGGAMTGEWPTLALFWFAPRNSGGIVDPIFGKPLNFFSCLPCLPGRSSPDGCLR